MLIGLPRSFSSQFLNGLHWHRGIKSPGPDPHSAFLCESDQLTTRSITSMLINFAVLHIILIHRF
ncbi:hypothetical protein TSAR_014790 [Trichomalopsis sarcophagae]|uniref:Uncharacterized protein n=1 Tax=Trichomalopsis sarcophagae TaxID=543379 RepID=A0A232ELU1_9HYME|nr:hypothetical protein TSAR_014790 [Trichomalopsis sarcophagae]